MAEPREVHDHLEVARTQTVAGHLYAGATVKAGARLTVQGLLEGDVTVEESGILMVMGTFSGRTLRNNGTLLVYGVAVFGEAVPVGRVGVGVQSVVVVGSETYVLEEDGTLAVVQGNISAGSLSVSTHKTCYYDPSHGQFRPL